MSFVDYASGETQCLKSRVMCRSQSPAPPQHTQTHAYRDGSPAGVPLFLVSDECNCPLFNCPVFTVSKLLLLRLTSDCFHNRLLCPLKGSHLREERPAHCRRPKVSARGGAVGGKELPGLPQGNQGNPSQTCPQSSLIQTVLQFPGDPRLRQVVCENLASRVSVRKDVVQLCNGSIGRVSEATTIYPRTTCRSREQAGIGQELLLAVSLGMLQKL